MTSPLTPTARSAQLEVEETIELYHLHVGFTKIYTPGAADIDVYFTPMTTDLETPPPAAPDTPDHTYTYTEVSYGGQIYQPIVCDMEGLDRESRGAMPQPTISIGNLGGVFAGLVMQYDDLIGAEITRIETYWQYLDTVSGGTFPDGTAHTSLDTFIIEAKTGQTRERISFRLRNAVDVTESKVPARQMHGSRCQHRYRVWDPTAAGGAGAFSNLRATCPYVTLLSFDFYNVQVTNPNDNCNKGLAACKLRFGALPLPFLGFPGLG